MACGLHGCRACSWWLWIKLPFADHQAVCSMPSMDVFPPSMQLRSGHHQNHVEELTSELTVSDWVLLLTSGLQLGARNYHSYNSHSVIDGIRRSARPASVPSFSIHTFTSTSSPVHWRAIFQRFSHSAASFMGVTITIVWFVLMS